MSPRAPKRRKTGHSSDDEDASSVPAAALQKAFFKNATTWDLEADYESRKRKNKKKEKKENTRLPIKTADGRVQQLRALEEDAAAVDSVVEWLDDEGDAADVEDEPVPRPTVREEPELPEPVQILNAKNELAKLALAINEDPEENVGSLKTLAEIGRSRVEAVQKLALATQMAVYKDVIPGYRIRPLSEEGAAAEKLLSKEVRRLRAYEQSLVVGYGNYVKELLGHAKAGGGTATVAIACACTLLAEVPHFNFRGELLGILVGKLSRRATDGDSVKCLQALQGLFRDDDEGRPSMEAVSMLYKMMRSREFWVDEAVVNLFLHLRLLAEFTGTGSATQVDRPEGGPDSGKAAKAKREYLTKRERKERKERKALEKVMSQADALVGHEERDRMQSEMLKLVFACYFRILKARVPHLMGAVLEGLARYSHLINQDFFGDILEALKDLIRHGIDDAEAGEEGDDGGRGRDDGAADAEEDGSDGYCDRNLTRESLLCISTAFALLAGQDAHNSRHQLHLDLTFFATHLFTSLLPLATNPDLELTPKSRHLREVLCRQQEQQPSLPSRAGSRVNAHTTTVLLVRSLTSVLMPRWNVRSVPPLRLAAFTKQLMGTALHLPEKSARAVLALLGDVADQHGAKVSGLWNTEERRGDGTWLPLSTSVEGSNPRAATVWEGEILRRHFSPAVREGVGMLEKSVCGS